YAHSRVPRPATSSAMFSPLLLLVSLPTVRHVKRPEWPSPLSSRRLWASRYNTSAVPSAGWSAQVWNSRQHLLRRFLSCCLIARRLLSQLLLRLAFMQRFLTLFPERERPRSAAYQVRAR